MNFSIRSIIRLVFGKILPRIAYPVVRGPLRGARFILGAFAGEGGGATVYFNMIEIEQTAAFIKELGVGQVLFDIGANVGYYTILGSRLVGSQGRIISVEPVVRNLVYLYKHTLLNKSSNVSIITVACSDNQALATFSSGENFAMGGLANRPNGENTSEKTSFLVSTTTVDSIVEQLGVYPDVMKVDVEGAEFLVLKGARVTLKEAKPRIFLSTHSEVLRSNCLEFLAELGYTYEILSQDKENPSEFLVK